MTGTGTSIDTIRCDASGIAFQPPVPAALRAAVIAAGDMRLRRIQTGLMASGRVLIFRAYSCYPTPLDVDRLLGAARPDLILLDFDDREAAIALARQIHESSPGTALVGFGGFDSDKVPPAGTGIARVIAGFPTLDELRDSIRAAVHAVRGGAVDNLYAFLPGKAGDGASTIVLNAAAAASAAGRKVLVVEADLRSGVMSVLLGHKPAGSIQTLLDRDEELDVFSWDRLINRVHNVDFLFSARTPCRRLPHWEDYFGLLEFARRRYDLLLVDLPEVVNDATAEFVRRAKNVFIVCRQDLPSVFLARVRMEEILSHGARPSSPRALVNRARRGEFPVHEIANVLGQPVFTTFPEDAAALREALREGRPAGGRSGLGRACRDFAARLLETPEGASRRSAFSLASLLWGRGGAGNSSQPA